MLRDRDDTTPTPKASNFTTYNGSTSEIRQWLSWKIEVDYPLHDRDVLVTACGRICMHRKKINISTVMAGQRLGNKEVDDGIWLVSFMTYDLGYIDLEQKTLQPIDNPFGARVSHMS